jgi:hypothetical protein
MRSNPEDIERQIKAMEKQIEELKWLSNPYNLATELFTILTNPCCCDDEQVIKWAEEHQDEIIQTIKQAAKNN